MYRLCSLTKPAEQEGGQVGHTLMMTTWIRSEVAIAGRVLSRLKDNETGVIRHGWLVASVGETERPESFLIGRSRAHAKTRKASDI